MVKEVWDYQVITKQLRPVEGEQLVRSKLATVEESTGDILGLVSPRYTPIQNTTLYGVMQSVGKDIGLKLQTVSVCKNKAVTVFRYGFGEKHETTIKNSVEANDKIQFGIEIVNSFDTTRFGSSYFRMFALRLACLNGQTLPHDISRFSFRSCGDFTPDNLATTIWSRVTVVSNAVKIWETWAERVPNRSKVGEFVSSNLGKKAAIELLANFDGGKDKTTYGLYNLLTYYVTHRAKVRDTSALRLKQFELEKTIEKMYNFNLQWVQCGIKDIFGGVGFGSGFINENRMTMMGCVSTAKKIDIPQVKNFYKRWGNI